MSGLLFPLPARLRPTAPSRAPRRRLVVLAVLVPVALLVTPMWRLGAVESNGCPGVPAVVHGSLHDLVGTSPLAVDLAWVRRQLAVWPAVAVADVRLRLPAALRITTEAAEAVASVPIGRGWHGVDRRGDLVGALPSAQAPVLLGFTTQRRLALRRALVVAERLEHLTGASVESVRAVMPGDLEVTLRTACPQLPRAVVHVTPNGTAAEQRWSALVGSCAPTAAWADLRSDNRMVLGGDR